MAGPYGNTAAIKALLKASQGTTFTADNSARLDDLNVTVSLIVEDKLGRTFGATAADSTVLFWSANSDVLILPKPIRTITTVTVGGTVTGTTMTGGSVLNTTYWTPAITNLQTGDISALRLLSGGYWGAGVPVTITGQWAATDADATVPADLVYAVNYLVAERFKIEQASPAGFTGPDGTTIPIRDPFKDPIWLAVQEKYGVSNRELVL